MRGWLIDKSAIRRLHRSTDVELWTDRIECGLVRIGTVTRLEVGYSARSAADHHTLLAEPPLASSRSSTSLPASRTGPSRSNQP